MHVVHLRPGHPALASQVERLWRGSAPAGPLPPLFPGTGAELWFHRGAVPRLRAADGSAVALPAAHLVCLRAAAWQLEATGPLEVLVVRLRAGALAGLLGPRVDRLCDTVVDLGRLWGLPGPHLTRAAAEPALLEGLLAELSAPVEERLRAAETAVRLLRGAPAGPGIELLAARLGTSARTLQRTVPAVAGVGPHRLRSLARFQRFARSVRFGTEGPGHLARALAAGYYDQSHAIREVRRLTGRRPGALAEPGVSFFSYPPLD
ncbi:AraC family transcriptional regulator [Kitasatospora sp. NA04385]|uniref:AraC family transcriptional regulator n=1 Tax=Kitasatospora sp. NA04385 TaxID=2742135 RepID=UPI0015909F91|nr:helix-turn-helix domain-containing protein [Kitasatospora sp. NA04385]QKW23385.1 AraC family transcriptional regulator [Kitasatospora sp. NA04385]